MYREMVTYRPRKVYSDGSILESNWHNLSQTMVALDGTVMAEAYAGVGSPWFSGHFPGEPILPGIAILSMVKDAIRSSESKQGRRIRISSIRRVRFKLPVRPDQLLKISLSLSCQDEGISYRFNVVSR